MSNEQVTVVKNNGDEVTLPLAEAMELVNARKAKALQLSDEAFVAAAQHHGVGIVTDNPEVIALAKAWNVHVQPAA